MRGRLRGNDGGLRERRCREGGLWIPVSSTGMTVWARERRYGQRKDGVGSGQTGWVLPLEGEDGDDCDYGEGECAEVADGGCQGLGYGQLEVGGERGDAMGNVE